MSPKKNNKPFLLWAEVDLSRLRQNLRAIRAWLERSSINSLLTVEILAIVKADAYGHGLKNVATTLRKSGVNFFGVANIEEAEELRAVCPDSKILVLGSFHGDQVRRYCQGRITPTISSEEDMEAFEKRAGDRRPFGVHVKIDTGMGRLGIWHEEVPKIFKKWKNFKHVAVEGLYTHFPNADKKEKSFTENQIRLFNEAVKRVRAFGFNPLYLHAANSMGLMRFRRAHLNLVRPGIVLYGLNPAQGERLPVMLKPVLSLKTRIAFLKKAGTGRTLSYGATHQLQKPSRIATLPVGYSHGYRVALSNKGIMLVRGRRCPVVGRVTMDQTLLDVGKVPHVKRWDEVVLIGRQANQTVTAEELAALSQTIPYEILCSIHPRIPRIYKF